MRQNTHSAGFTLIELLIGLLIAMMGTLAIMQAFTSREGDRRSIGSMSDTNTNANIAMFLLERDLQQAGSGFLGSVVSSSSSNIPAFGCTISASGILAGQTIAPLGIIPSGAVANPWNIPAGDSNSDMFVVMYGTSINASEGISLGTAGVVAGDTVVPLVGVSGLAINMMVLIAEPDKTCSLARVVTTNTALNNVTLDAVVGDSYSSAARLFNLGTEPRFVAYAVRSGNLTVCDMIQNDCANGTADPTVWVPVVNDIVAITAQRGVDTSVPMDGYVDQYCPVFVGNSCSGIGTMSACDHARSLAVRMAVVGRSPEQSKTDVSPLTMTLWPTSTSPATTGPSWTVPDRKYRYRAVNTNVTLRNLQLMGTTSGC